MDILNVIALICCTTTGVVAGWVWGYKAGFRMAVREGDEFIGRLYHDGWLPSEVFCTQCKAPMPNHYHKCPIAAEFKLFTIAKPGG